jgi:hypothetical protein
LKAAIKAPNGVDAPIGDMLRLEDPLQCINDAVASATYNPTYVAEADPAFAIVVPLQMFELCRLDMLSAAAVASVATTPAHQDEADRAIPTGAPLLAATALTTGILGRWVGTVDVASMNRALGTVQASDRKSTDWTDVATQLKDAQSWWPYLAARGRGDSVGGGLVSQLGGICELSDSFGSLSLQADAAELIGRLQELDNQCRRIINQLAETLRLAAGVRSGRADMLAILSAIHSDPVAVDPTVVAVVDPRLGEWGDSCRKAFARAGRNKGTFRVLVNPVDLTARDQSALAILSSVAIAAWN